jgi:predicted TIM-barrel fold metal-dependent hydrolase
MVESSYHAVHEQAEPILIVSSDSHAGPSLTRDLRPFCPARYLDEFDDFAAHVAERGGHLARTVRVVSEEGSSLLRQALALTTSCPGQTDPAARLRDMDASGIAAEVIFAGGQNGEILPFVGQGWDAGVQEISPELRAVGNHFWNEWLAGFVAAAPERLLGTMQIPIWDIHAAIREMRWARGAGLRVVNLPAPRSDLLPYNDLAYEPFWSVCEELQLPLVTHGGGGDRPLGFPGPGGMHLNLYEQGWLSRRHLWQLIFGGVFERHPNLRLMFTEQRVRWVGPTLSELDSIYYSDDWARDLRKELPRSPSEYWASNCYNGGSFLTKWEAATMREEVGIDNLCWGSDYPHYEGTWPDTELALRNTFSDLPEEDTRKILGENAIRALFLDRQTLESVARAIGPTPTELSKPVEQQEFPEFRSGAFRNVGCWSS